MRPLLTSEHILLVNRSCVRLYIPASPLYELTQPETITLNLNATDDTYVPVTTSGQLYHAELGVLEPAATPLMRMSGEFLGRLDMNNLRRDPVALKEGDGLPVVNLTLCCGLEFNLPAVRHPITGNVSHIELAQSLGTPQREENGWHENIRPGLYVQEVTSTHASFILPPNPQYLITAPGRSASRCRQPSSQRNFGMRCRGRCDRPLRGF